MKKKYADYYNWDKVKEKEYINKYFNNNDFKGNISLLTVVKVKEKIVSKEKNIIVLDDGFRWLEFYPEENKNIAVTANINNKNQIIEWYFDIAKDSSLTEEGVPYINDLYLDITLSPSGDIKILDEDELQEALNKGDITKEEFNLAYKVAKMLVKQLKGNLNKLTEFTYRYLNLLDDYKKNINYNQ